VHALDRQRWGGPVSRLSRRVCGQASGQRDGARQLPAESQPRGRRLTFSWQLSGAVSLTTGLTPDTSR